MAIAVVLSGLVGDATAGERVGVACPFRTNEALALASIQLAQLYASRAVPRYMDTDMPPDEFAEALTYYLNPNDLGKGRRGGLLFYVSKGDDVCVLFGRMSDGSSHASDGQSHQLAFDLHYLAGTAAEIAQTVDTKLTMLLATGDAPVRVPIPRIDVIESQDRSVLPMTGLRVRQSDADRIFPDLADLLIPQQVAAEIERLDDLTIVPALNLGRVPFGALDPDRDGRPLMDRVVINVESSLISIFEREVFAWSSEPLVAPVVFGDPDATSDTEWLLPRLPGAGREAALVAARLGTTAVTGGAATRERLLAAMPNAEYIHIAAHGIASVDAPMDKGFLALAGGRLTAREIQGLKLQRFPVVVLSACQSGLGGPIEAGIIGVARGFIIAGASTVVASLWNVDDEATAWIMDRFVENLKHSGPPDALRQAQIAAREKWPSPRIWAAFISFGSRFVAL